jgi:hypothetical protein
VRLENKSKVESDELTSPAVARIPSSLVSDGPVDTAAPEQEQATSTAAARTQEGDVGQ